MKKALLALTVVAAFAGQAWAQTNLFWDGDGAGAQGGGAGAWNTTTVHFSTTSGGTVNQIWNNVNGDSATFNATAGAVTLTGPISVNTVNVTVSGYSIGNGNGVGGTGNTLTLVGTNPGFNISHTSGTTSLSALVSGTLRKTGAGRLEINNSANVSTTKWVVAGGALTAPASNRFGTAPGSLVSDFFTLDGGAFGANTTTAYDLGSTRGVTIGAGGGFFGFSAATVILTVSSPIVGTAGGDVTVNTAAAQLVGSAHTTASTLVLSNTGNSWNGNLNALTGTVRLGVSDVIPNTAIVNLAAGATLDLATNSASDTVKSISGAGGTISLGTGTLTLNNPTGETFGTSGSGGSITGSGSIIKDGAGSITLAQNTSTYTGAANAGVSFTLNTGKVGIAVNPAFGTGSLVINNSPTLSAASSGGRAPTNNVTLNGNVTMDDSFTATPGTITWGATGTWTITGATRTITVNTAANNSYLVAISGVVGEDAAGRGLIKAGNGILALNNAANTYSGATTINAGQINVDSDGTLGNGAGNVILNGGALSATASRSGSGSIVLNPVNVLASSSIISSAGAASPVFEFSGALTGTSGQTLTFRDDNNVATQFKPRFSGAFTMNSSIDMPTGSGTLLATVQLESFNTTSTTQTFNGVISGTGSYNRSASVSGTGGDTVFSAANTYSGGTILNQGSLTVTNTSGSGTGTGGITINAQGVLNVGNGGASGAVSGNITDNGIVNFNRSDTPSYGGVISGSGTVTQSGSGTLTLTATNSYSGKTTVANGTLAFTVGDLSANANQSLGTNAAVDLGVAATSSGILQYTGPGPDTLAKNINVLGNGGDTIQNSGGGLLTLSGTITKNGTTLTLKGGATGITVSGTITGSSPNSDLVVDGGTTNLESANSYNGPTFIINGGTLNANAANALPTNPARTAVTIDQSGSGGSALALGVSQSAASLAGASTSTVSLNANTLTVGMSGGTTTFAGTISGSGGALIKDGASTLTLGGANTYTGGTTVSAGTLRVTNATASGTGTGAVDVNGADVATPVLTGTGIIDGAVTVRGGATVAPGAAAAVGSLTVNNAVTIGATGSTGTLKVRISPDGTTSDVLTLLGSATDSLSFVTDGVGNNTAVAVDFGLVNALFETFTTYHYTVATAANATNPIVVNTIPIADNATVPVNVVPINYASPATFSLSRSGSSLVLDFTPVPEPVCTTAVFAAGLGGAAWLRRRRQATKPLAV